MTNKFCDKHLRSSDITPENIYRSRRTWMKSLAVGALGLPTMGIAHLPDPNKKMRIPFAKDKKIFTSGVDTTPYEDVTRYNNFYEFGMDKEDPFKHAHQLKTEDWKVKIGGEVLKPRVFDMDQLMKVAPLEERVYRLRCVEAWSMVIPWIGFPLSKLLDAVQPTGNAKYVEFLSLYDPDQMPGQKSKLIDWPYAEGLRIDEAMNPLTLLTVGLYGEILPNQNGAPVRVVVPWKYGFKSAKSIVAINLREKQPKTSWNNINPSEYGFYSNVNPSVSHPRWSQSKERVLGEFFKTDTKMFNGYGDWVSDLYRGMDLSKHF